MKQKVVCEHSGCEFEIESSTDYKDGFKDGFLQGLEVASKTCDAIFGKYFESVAEKSGVALPSIAELNRIAHEEIAKIPKKLTLGQIIALGNYMSEWPEDLPFNQILSKIAFWRGESNSDCVPAEAYCDFDEQFLANEIQSLSERIDNFMEKNR
jgi:hypothetical protein